MALDVGQAAPNVTLVDENRKEVRLADLPRPVVLLFFPAAFSGGCEKEMCTIRDMWHAFSTLGVPVYGISVDMPYAQKAFKDHHSLPMTFLSDFNKEAIRAFGVVWPALGGTLREVANRAAFVLDLQGVVRYRWIGEAPGAEPPYDDVTRAIERVKATA